MNEYIGIKMAVLYGEKCKWHNSILEYNYTLTFIECTHINLYKVYAYASIYVHRL